MKVKIKMDNNSYSKKYILNKIHTEAFGSAIGAAAGTVNNALGNMAPAHLMLASMAMPAVAQGLVNVTDSIKNVIANYQYGKKNCQALDPIKKETCLNVQRNRAISMLVKAKSRCAKDKNPQSCYTRMDNEINRLRQG
jgi:hypothetical protein